MAIKYITKLAPHLTSEQLERVLDCIFDFDNFIVEHNEKSVDDYVLENDALDRFWNNE